MACVLLWAADPVLSPHPTLTGLFLLTFCAVILTSYQEFMYSSSCVGYNYKVLFITRKLIWEGVTQRIFNVDSEMLQSAILKEQCCEAPVQM